MMKAKRIAALILSLMMAGTLAACGSSSTSSSSSTESAASASSSQAVSSSTEASSSASSSQTASTGNSKILVMYFDQGENSDGAGDDEVDAVTSASLANGVPDGIEQNDILAMKNEIIKQTGADEYAIRVNETYADSYDDMVEQARDDQDEDKQFTFKEDLPDISGYDTIFIGMPVWWGALPQPVVNVFQQMDFSGKTIVPFGINLGSRFGRMVDQIEEMEPDATVSQDGLTIRGTTTNAEAVSDVDDWLAQLRY